MRSMRNLILRTAFLLLVAILLVYAVFPFYYAIVTSFETSNELYQVAYWPHAFNLENYRRVFTEQPFLRNIMNSAVVSVATVLVSLLLGVTASFALARVKFRGRKLLLLTILGVSMFPQVAVLSGLFELIRFIGLYNRLPGLILSYVIFSLPFTVWILTTFMRAIPRELEEAAIVDGATPWQIVTRIFLPVLLPALVTTGLLTFIAAWNEFLFAITFILSNDARTVPVAIALLSGASEFELPWGQIMAASVTVTVPLVLLVLVFQRRIIDGLMAGSVKG